MQMDSIYAFYNSKKSKPNIRMELKSKNKIDLHLLGRERQYEYTFLNGMFNFMFPIVFVSFLF